MKKTLNILALTLCLSLLLVNSVFAANGAKMFGIPNVAYSTESAGVALNGFNSKLGYPSAFAVTAAETTKAKILDYIHNDPNGYGFYFDGHGGDSTNTRIISSDVNAVYPSEITGNWHFVYIDACYTGQTDSWAKAFKILYDNGGYYSKRAFLGWYDTVTVYAAYDFLNYYFEYVPGETVRNAALDAAARTWGSTPTRFFGDPNYNGASY